MLGGWLVFAVVACIILCTGCILAVALLKAAWSQREREALTSEDLRALEESALCLIDQLKAEADNAASDLESRCSLLRDLMKAADERIAALRELEPACLDSPAQSASRHESRDEADAEGNLRRQQILELASKGVECSEIARAAGMDCAEVKLMLRLAGTRMN